MFSKTGEPKVLKENKMEEVNDQGINVDEYLANLKAKGQLPEQEVQFPKTNDVIVPPDPMDPKPVETTAEVVEDPDAPVTRMQWIKGEKTGTVEEVKGDDGEWIVFKSGGRVNKSLVGEYMTTVDSSTPLINVHDELIGVSHQSHTGGPVGQTQVVQKPVSPVATLLEKSSQTVELEIKLKIKADAPNEALMSVLIDSFGDEAIEEVKDYILSQVDTKALNEAAKEEVLKIVKKATKS